MSTKIKFLFVLFIVLTTPLTIAAQTPLTWELILKIVAEHPNFTVKYWQMKIPASKLFNTSERIQCYGEIIFPLSESLEKILDVDFAELKAAGQTTASIDFVKKEARYSFEVNGSYCNSLGGGGGAAQFSFNRIWLLIIAAIFAMLAAGTLRRRLQPIEI